MSILPESAEDRLAFTPGQYVTIGFTGENGRPSPMRSFSITSTPEQNQLEFAVRIQGQFTQTLAGLKVGAKIFLLGPFGEFVINKSSRLGAIFLAGGIGITPFISMIRDATRRQSPLPITLLYGLRNQDNILFYNELNELEKQNSHFRVGYFIGGGPINKIIGQNAVSGMITKEWLGRVTGGNAQKYSYYLCGPKGMTAGLTNILTESGVSGNQIFSESFSGGAKVKLKNGSTARATIYKLAMWSLVATFFIVVASDLKQNLPKFIAQTQAQSTQFQTPPSQTADPNQAQATTTPNNNYYYSSPNYSTYNNSVPSATYQPPRTMMS